MGIWQHDCNGTQAQQFIFRFNDHYQMTKRGTNKCLDFASNENWNGGKFQQWECLGAGQNNQKFYFHRSGPDPRYFVIQSQMAGRCVDVAWGSQANKQTIWQHDCNWTGAQLFRLG